VQIKAVHVDGNYFQDDDVYDRFSHRWTIILLGVFILAISAKQFVGMWQVFRLNWNRSVRLGTPIECIPPPDFAGNHKTYVENFCWIHYTYSGKQHSLLSTVLVITSLLQWMIKRR
jgi:hypothetical protein